MPEDTNAQFKDRETAYNNSIGSVIAQFAIGVVDADAKAKDAQTERIMKVADAPNLMFQAGTSLIGMEQKLTTGISVPRLTAQDNSSVGIDEAELEGSMTVTASRDDNLSIKNRDTVAGGFGLFGAGGGFSATVGVDSERKRHSDYTATTKYRLKMKQMPVPEGLAKILDAMQKTVLKGLEINEKLVDGQVGHGEATTDSAAMNAAQNKAVDDRDAKAEADQKKAIEAAGGDADGSKDGGTK